MKTRVLFSSICTSVLASVCSQTRFADIYLLHGGLSVERVDENLGGIHARLMGDRLAGVLARARELEGLGAVDC